VAAADPLSKLTLNVKPDAARSQIINVDLMHILHRGAYMILGITDR